MAPITNHISTQKNDACSPSISIKRHRQPGAVPQCSCQSMASDLQGALSLLTHSSLRCVCLQAGAEAPEEAAGYLAAAKARLGLSRLQSVRVHHCAQVM